jgi:hypothetical protein
MAGSAGVTDVLFLNSGELEAAVGDTFQHAVELGLIMKDTAQDGDTITGFGRESLKACREALGQMAADGDAIVAGFHGSSFGLVRIIRISWVTRLHPSRGFTLGERRCREE